LRPMFQSNHVFNFFVTAFHVADYLDKRLKKKVRKKSWFQLCGDAGNKAKHMELEPTYGRPDPKTPNHITLATTAIAIAVTSVRMAPRWNHSRLSSSMKGGYS